MYRTGIGLDSHVLVKKDKNLSYPNKKNLVLAGIEINNNYFFEADSDGDVIIHSLCNAFSTAIGGGSLDTWAGDMFRSGIVDSREFLKFILKKVYSKGFKISNIAVMVEGKKPRLEIHRSKMQKSLSKLCLIPTSKVGIAFTTGEGLTAFGKGEGIQAFSSVTIYEKNNS